MKKTYILSFLLILSACNIFSQSGWFWQNPLPQGNDLYSVQFIDNLTGYAVGSAGCFMKTTNNGFNWDDKYYVAGSDVFSTQDPKPIRALYFNNSLTGFVGSASTYNNNIILRTTNGGISWDSVTSAVYPAFYTIFFTNQNIGWACGGNNLGSTVILKSTNSGLSWNSVSNSLDPIHSCYFINSLTGWFTGDHDVGGPISNHIYYIYKTTNGGASFTNQIYLGGYTYLNSIYFLNENTGWAGGSKLFITTNSGLNWTIKDTSANAIRFVNNSTGFFVGSNGVFKTTNSGILWFSQSTTSGNSISLTDINNAYIVGNFGSLSKTDNGGDNWIDISSYVTTFGLNSIKFVNYSTGYIIENSGDYSIGFRSRILKSTNQGNTWSIASVLSADLMFDQSFINVNTGWVAGTKKILKTINGGLSWDTVFNNSTQRFNAICFKDENLGCAVSDNHASAFITLNGGLNWRESVIPYYSSGKVYMFDVNNILLINGSGILRTSNSGLNWQVIGSYSGFQCSSINSNNNIYAKNYHSIYKSPDLGVTWNTVSDLTPTNMYSLQMIDDLTGYASGLGGFIVKTTNGGINWNRQNSKTSVYIRSIFFSNVSTGWAVGEGGTIISTVDGGGNIVELDPTSNIIPKNYSLQQNYPNPFNPVTKIKFYIPQRHLPLEGGDKEGVLLKIYDLLGREITTLVNEQLSPGSYSIDWDGTGFASGVYFYSLVTNDFVETKRMVLIK